LRRDALRCQRAEPAVAPMGPVAHRAFPHDYATVVVDHVLTAIGHAIADKHEDPA